MLPAYGCDPVREVGASDVGATPTRALVPERPVPARGIWMTVSGVYFCRWCSSALWACCRGRAGAAE